jgi:glycosyltransferase involved in cell wall biosynthesis
LTIAALRHAGFDVVEVHASIWGGAHDKAALLASPRVLVRIGLRLTLVYIGLTARALRRMRHADIVMFGYIGQLDLLLFGPLLRLLGKPVVFNPLVTLSDTLIEDRKKFGPHSFAARVIRLIDRTALSLADVILVDSAENGLYLNEQFGIQRERIHVIPVGADESVFAPACRRVDRADRSDLSVLFYGNMIPLQGVETIVRAARLLLDEGVRFEVIGSGQTLGAARALADKTGATNIEWIGRVPYADLPRRILRADVVLGIFGDSAKAGRVVPNKVYQAMAMGAAIVTRDSPAQRAMLADGVSALLVPPADPAALADAIRRLRDPELRLRLGAAARQNFVERASLAVLADRLHGALSTIEFDATARRTGSVPS